MTSAQIAIMTTIILYLCLVIFTGVMIGKRSKKSAEGFYLGGLRPGTRLHVHLSSDIETAIEVGRAPYQL